MAETLTDILIGILEELSPEELERFKLLLTKEDKPLVRGKQGVNLTQLVQGMDRAYTEEGSIERTLHILEKMDLCDLVKKINKKMEGLSKRDPSPSPVPKQEENFFTKHKAELEKRLPLISTLLCELERFKILNSMEREAVEVERTSSAQNHVLIVLLSKKGKGAQEKFYEILKKTDPHLVDDLEGN